MIEEDIVKHNMGSADRIIRTFVVAPLLVVVGVLVGPTAWLSWLLYLLAVVMVATSAVSFCPLYTLFGIRTCRAADVESHPSVGSSAH